MKMRLIETVEVINDQGELKTVSIYQRMIRNPFGGFIHGMKRVIDEAGDHVNTSDGVAFEVVDTGEILTRVWLGWSTHCPGRCGPLSHALASSEPRVISGRSPRPGR
jgi:hypothetical protein